MCYSSMNGLWCIPTAMASCIVDWHTTYVWKCLLLIENGTFITEYWKQIIYSFSCFFVLFLFSSISRVYFVPYNFPCGNKYTTLLQFCSHNTIPFYKNNLKNLVTLKICYLNYKFTIAFERNLLIHFESVFNQLKCCPSKFISKFFWM